MARKRSGFTLIELLVVVGIILVLMGIAVIAFAKLDKVAGKRAMRTRLELLTSVLNEYELNAGSLSAIESVPNASTQGFYYPVFPDPVGAPPYYIDAPGSVSVRGGGSNGDLGNDRYYNASPMAVYGATSVWHTTPSWNTAIAMLQIMQVPAAANLLSQLPGTAMLTSNSGTIANTPWTCTYAVTPTAPKPPMTNANNEVPLPVVVDAWKNPIIFVPAGGMKNVYIGGNIPPSGLTSTTTGGPWASIYTVVSRDHRPFWASAGQDGNFSMGDDNLYSCPVILVPGP